MYMENDVILKFEYVGVFIIYIFIEVYLGFIKIIFEFDITDF